MDHLITRITEDMIARVTGPMKFRLFLQPAMATFFAIRDGLKDAREGNPALLLGPIHRQRGKRAGVQERLEGRGKGVHPRGSARCGLSAHRAPLDRLSRRGNPGGDHSSHYPLPAVPWTYQSNRPSLTQSRKRTIGWRLDLHGNQLPNRTHGEWPRPSHDVVPAP